MARKPERRHYLRARGSNLIPPYFFDSSALTKHYQAENGSERVETIFKEPDHRIIISRLAAVEVHSAVSRRVRMRELTPETGDAIRSRLLKDVAERVLTLVAVTGVDFARAERLLVRYGYLHPLRTLDALQLAVALKVNNRLALKSFVAADRTLSEVAALEGLTVMNPEIG